MPWARCWGCAGTPLTWASPEQKQHHAGERQCPCHQSHGGSHVLLRDSSARLGSAAQGAGLSPSKGEGRGSLPAKFLHRPVAQDPAGSHSVDTISTSLDWSLTVMSVPLSPRMWATTTGMGRPKRGGPIPAPRPSPAGSGHGLASLTGRWSRAHPVLRQSPPNPPQPLLAKPRRSPSRSPAPSPAGPDREPLRPRRLPLADKARRSCRPTLPLARPRGRHQRRSEPRSRSPPFPVQLLLFPSPGAQSLGSADGLPCRCGPSAPNRPAQPLPAGVLG